MTGDWAIVSDSNQVECIVEVATRRSALRRSGANVPSKRQAPLNSSISAYERGLDLLIGAFNFIDLTAKGRNERHPMDILPANWLELHGQAK